MSYEVCQMKHKCKGKEKEIKNCRYLSWLEKKHKIEKLKKEKQPCDGFYFYEEYYEEK